MMDFDVASINDIPGLITLVNSAYRGQAARKGWTHEADLLEGDARIDEGSLREMLNDPESAILTVRYDGVVAGCVHLQNTDGDLYLGMLSVSPGLQAHGIGRQLLTASEAYGRSKGSRRIYMTVISLRTALIDWYMRRGYQLTGKSKPLDVDPKHGRPVQPLTLLELDKKL